MNKLLAPLSALCLALAGSSAAHSADDAQAYVQQSVGGLQAQLAANDGLWRLSEAASWSVDQDQGQITFSFDNGKRARAPVQIIGTYNPANGTFLWGWDHPSVLPPMRQHAALAKAWGEQHQQPQYTTRLVRCTEEEAWAFTAVAARLGGASGAYRARSGGPIVFVSFGTITLDAPKP